ncbi:MAG TPA: glycosyltransferase [Miltoncostaeaceae bacterium]|nr:glycosyltransferase [Miltoncostaeaceae bacterium]
MRIVLVTPMPPSATGAGAIPRLLHAQVMALHGGHDLTVITVAGPDEEEVQAVEDLRREGVDVRGVLQKRTTRAERWRRRGRLAYGWCARRYPWRSTWYWAPGVDAALAHRLAEGPVDVIHAEDNATGMYRYAGAATVLTEHEVRRPRPLTLAGDGSLPRHVLGEVDWRRWRRYQLDVWSRFDLLQVFTPRDASLVAQIAPPLAARVRINPFAVEIPPVCDPGLEAPGEMLFMGNFTHPPNVDAAVWLARDILPAVCRIRPEARLVLVGSQMPPSVVSLAGETVRVVGRVPDVRPWLERAQLVVAPVRIGGGMRMKVLEAMASGKAVVTTGRGAEGMDGAPLARGEDVGTLAAAVAGLLADREGRRRLADAARRYAVERHSPEAYLGRLETVYAEAIEMRQAGAPAA